ncbi:MAG: hypothetical protein ACW9XA_08855 [Candidatus Nitrosopumilus sp. bin_6a]
MGLLSINKTVFLGVTFAALFAVMMVSPAVADDSTHLDIEKAEVKEIADGFKVEIKTGAEIPQDGSAGAFGYGVLTAGASNVLAVTTHKCASDSFEQGSADDCDATVGLLRLFGGDESEHNDATFHPHILDLKVPDVGTFCADEGTSFEVDISGTVGTGNNVSPSNYELEVKDDKIEVIATMDESNVDPDGSSVAVASFNIIPNTDEDGLITHLCVDVDNLVEVEIGKVNKHGK